MVSLSSLSLPCYESRLHTDVTESPPLHHSPLHTSEQPVQPFSFDSMPYYDTNTFANEFGSEAANLEYAILSSMLNGNGFSDPIDTYANEDMRLNGGADGNSMLMRSPVGGGNLILPPVASTSTAVNGGGPNGVYMTGSNNAASIFDQPRNSTTGSPRHAFNNVLSPQLHEATSPAQDLYAVVGANLTKRLTANGRATQGVSPTDFAADSHLTSFTLNGTRKEGSLPPPETTSTFRKDTSGRTAQSTRMLTAEQAYRNVTKPYPYAQSYHYLVKHLKDR